VGFQLEVEGVAQVRVRRSLLRILRKNPLCAVATVTSRGRAHVHICYFAFSEELELFFLSEPSSGHARNVRTNRSAAAAVFSSAQTWGGPDRGVQLFGSCALVSQARARMAAATYAARFPAYLHRPSSASLRFYRLRPTALKLLDEREFGDAVFIEARLRPSPP
jgi:uncharacterized protein YhbP (UPF0306 family)